MWASRGEAALAARLLGAAQELLERQGSHRPKILENVAARAAALARERPGEEAFASALAQGRAMPLPEAIGAARGPGATTGPGQRAAGGERLTQRELEVAALVARGLTNRQIAASLVIAEATAAVHVRHIMAKLDVTTRAQIAAWATQRAIDPDPTAD